MKILLLDNYDSFTYNLAYMLKGYGEVEVKRNDKISAENCLQFDMIVLSPGPGLPKAAGNMPGIISHCAGKIPILGICLGHQAIGEFLGAKLINLDKVYHGKKSEITSSETESNLFKNINPRFSVGRYHSWVLDPETITDEISVTAVSSEGQIMAIENNQMKLYGLQFHPESILTDDGDTMIANFIKMNK